MDLKQTNYVLIQVKQIIFKAKAKQKKLNILISH